MAGRKTADEYREEIAADLRAARELSSMWVWRNEVALARQGKDLVTLKQAAREAPAAWSLIDGEAPPRPPKTKVTLRLDKDVADWFRAQGRGHQTRMNDVLRAFMVMKAGGVV